MENPSKDQMGTGPWDRSPQPSLLAGDDLAALAGAGLLVLHFHPALALARVLALAGIVRAGASALALAIVDARALHGLRGCLVLVTLGMRVRRKQTRHCRRDHRALDDVLEHSTSPCWLLSDPSPMDGSSVSTYPCADRFRRAGAL